MVSYPVIEQLYDCNFGDRCTIITTIPAMQKLTFHLPHVQIIGTHHCGNTLREEFKRCESYQNVLCCRDYAEHAVDSFAHQIKS